MLTLQANRCYTAVLLPDDSHRIVDSSSVRNWPVTLALGPDEVVFCTGFVLKDRGLYAQFEVLHGGQNVIFYERVSRLHVPSRLWKEVPPLVVLARASEEKAR
jgi:hypothetical protein